MTMDPSQPQLSQQRLSVTAPMEETANDEEDDYLQVLDAGEHMYGMFVAEDEDLYAYLDEEDHNTIEDVISRSLDHPECVVSKQHCFCASFSDLRVVEDHPSDGNNNGPQDALSDTDDSATVGRCTPCTQNEEDYHDAMRE